jgi:hypothetical protein
MKILRKASKKKLTQVQVNADLYIQNEIIERQCLLEAVKQKQVRSRCSGQLELSRKKPVRRRFGQQASAQGTHFTSV